MVRSHHDVAQAAAQVGDKPSEASYPSDVMIKMPSAPRLTSSRTRSASFDVLLSDCGPRRAFLCAGFICGLKRSRCTSSKHLTPLLGFLISVGCSVIMLGERQLLMDINAHI